MEKLNDIKKRFELSSPDQQHYADKLIKFIETFVDEGQIKLICPNEISSSENIIEYTLFLENRIVRLGCNKESIKQDMWNYSDIVQYQVDFGHVLNSNKEIKISLKNNCQICFSNKKTGIEYDDKAEDRLVELNTFLTKKV